MNKSWKQKNKNNKKLSGCLPRARTGQRTAKACSLPRAMPAQRSAKAFAESCTLGKGLSAFVLKYEKNQIKKFCREELSVKVITFTKHLSGFFNFFCLLNSLPSAALGKGTVRTTVNGRFDRYWAKLCREPSFAERAATRARQTLCRAGLSAKIPLPAVYLPAVVCRAQLSANCFAERHCSFAEPSKHSAKAGIR